MSAKSSALSILATGLLVAPLSLLQAQDTRTVNQPTFPTTCTTLAATQSITTAGEPTSETAFDTTRIQTALSGAAAACSGATVELTTGGTNGVYNAFLINPIFIPSGVTLVVDAGVTVFGSRIPADYQVGTVGTGQEQCGVVGTLGNGCYPLITIGTSLSGGATSGSAIMGYGVINGRGGDTLLSATGTALTNPYPTVCTTYTWWCVATDANDVTNGAQNNPILVYAKGAASFTMYKITLLNSPMFHMKYTTASGFTAWDIKITTPYSSRNTDGIDLDDSVSNVTIANSYIGDGDDNIAIGATAGHPTTDITINGDDTYSGHGISVGSYTAGGVSNVLVENVNQSGNQNDTNAAGLKIKSAEDRGGIVNNIQYENICMQNQRYSLQFNPFYNTNTGTSYPQYNNIGLHNISITDLGVTTNQIEGFNATYPLGITFDNLYVAGGDTLTPVPEYVNITLGPGPVRPVALQTITGTDVNYSGSVTKPNEARYVCAAANYPFLAGELFLSTPGGAPALTNQQTLNLSNPASFTLNATLQITDASSPAPTAAIQFYTGTTLVGTASIGAFGAGNDTLATLNLTGVTSGVHVYTAEYPGDTNYTAQTFGSVTVNVGVIGTTTTMTATPTSTSYGSNVVLTATVVPVTGTVTPTGTVNFYSGGAIIGTGTLSATTPAGTATASATVSTLPVGTDSIYAAYAGSTQNGASNSSASPTLVTIAFANTTTKITASPTSAIYGSTITLTATVTTATTGTPTDTVTFYDGTTVLGTQTLTGNTAVFTTTALTAGTHSAITAVYGGDVNFNGSTSAAATPSVIIFTATTTTNLGLTASTAPYGTSITMFASINNGNATTATGNVIFTDGGTTIATVPVSSSAATYVTATLAVGTHTIGCSYSGDSNYTGSTCTTAQLVITQAGSSSVLTATSTSIVYGSSDTFTVTITPSISGAPTGTVTFKDGGTVIDTATVVPGTNSSAASFLDTTLLGGSHSITCTYSGDTNFTGSTCAALGITVTAASSTTTVSVPASITYGGSALLTANVTSTAAGTLTGTVTFKDGSTTLGTGTVSGGTASYTALGLTGGSHSITAVYSGDTNYATSTSSASTLVVNKANSGVTDSANPTTITFGSSTTLSATVTGVSGGVTPTGTVSFYNGGTLLGTPTLTSGSASLPITTLPTGTDSITAVYNGDTNYTTSTTVTAAMVTVNQATSTTGVSANPLTITYGASTLLTAMVTPAAASGTVTFKDGGVTIGTGTLSGGVATYNATALAGGTHSITAVYGGDTNDTGSASTAITVTVNTATTTTSVSANPSTITYGSATLLTATLSSTTATGTVTFKDSGITIGSGTVASGVATYNATALAGGTHSITAVYSGDTNYSGSTSTAITVTVNTAATTASVSANPSTITYGSATLLTATVSSTTATGTVTFKDSGTTLGTGTVASGVATYNATALAGGTHSITAVYSGDTNYSGSTSAAIAVTVNKASTSSAISANPTTLTYGATTNLTATVTPSTATGTFTFYDGTNNLGPGTIASGVATLNNVALGGGVHTITAVYSGDTNYNTSTTATAATVTVNQASGTATLTAVPSTITYGQSTLLTVTVPTAATGTVTFKDGTATLGSSTVVAGKATYTAANLAGGTHNLSCTYSGDTNYTGATCAVVVVTVNTAATTTGLSANPTTLTYGAASLLTATVSSTSATGTVTFKDGSNTLGTGTVTYGVATYNATTLPGGSHSITAVYSGDGNYAGSTSAAVTVTVNVAATTTGLTATPNPITYGNATLLSATISSTTATGTVTFKDGTTTLGTGTVGSGVATYNATALLGGSHNITAVYSGDTNYAGSTSAIVVVTVNTAAITAGITANPTTAGYGTGILLTVTLSNTAATGTVTFKDGTTVIGSPATVSSGVATLTDSSFMVGSHSITGVYSGDTNFSAATTATPAVVVINLGTTSSTVTAAPSTIAYGSATLLTATVSPATATGSFTFKDGSTTLGTGTISGGVATYNATALLAGAQSITAVYSGDVNYATSTSAAFTVTVSQLATTTGLTATPTAINYGSATLLSATVSSSSVTGTITFKDGTNTIGSPVTVSNGVASLSVTTLTVGTHSITAVYSGDNNYSTSASASVSVIVSLAPTTTSIAATPSTAPYGTSTLITVTVAPSGATGLITFKDGSTTLGTSSLSGGVATYSATLNAGTHTLSATYPGDANYAASATTTPASVVITVASSVVTVNANPSTDSFGDPNGVALTATIAPSGGTGSVTFTDSVMGTLGSATVSSGAATITGVVLIPAGNHSITATYSGDSNVGGSTSVAKTVVITRGGVNVYLGNAPASPVTYGTNVTLTANAVQPNLNVPLSTGTITYYDGTTVLGSATLSQSAAGVTTATFAIATLAPGSHSLTAVYSGDNNYMSNVSPANVLVVNQTTSTTTLVATPSQVTPGESFTLNATVAGTAGGTPTGSVTFYNSSNVSLGTVTLSGGTAASLPQSLSSLGTATYTAVYSGNADFTASTSAAASVIVKQLPSATGIVATPTSGTFGTGTYSVTATVSSTGGGTPTGSVVFKDGTTQLGTTQTLTGTDVATLSGLTLAGGVHNIVAYYSGDPTYVSSNSSTTVITVNTAATTTALNVTPATSSFGTSVTFTATISESTGTAATGTVNFMNGGTLLGTGTVSGGVASFTTSTLPIAVYTVTAVYSGDTNFTGSTSTATTVTVTLIPQTITVSSIPTNLTYGAAPFLVTASSSSGLVVSLAVSGPATLTGGTLSITGAGTVVVTATQAGTATYATATPVVGTITVAKAPLSVVVTNQSMFAGNAVPTLTGTFTGVVNGDNITVTYATTGTSSSPAGTYPITATLADPGNRLANYTVTNTPGTLTITANAQTITFPSLPTSVVYGAGPYTLSATASSGLTVTYTFTGPATLTGSTLAITGAGTVTVTASQAGNNVYAAASPITQTITVAKAPLSVVVNNQSMLAGATVPTLTGTFTGVVNGDNITVTYATTGTSSSPAGTYPITATLVDPGGKLVNYTAINTPGILTITANAQTITFPALPTSVVYGAGPYTLAATASSGLAVTYTFTGPASLAGSILSITGAGTVTVTASQAGNNIYSAATPITQTITVAKAPLSVIVNNQSMLVGATVPTLTGTFTGVVNGDNITVAYSTTGTSSSPAGTYPITATLTDPGNRLVNYTVTNTPGVLTISVGTQTITFPAIPTSVVYGTGPVTLTATASSGLAVTYSVTGPASLAGSVLTYTGAGTVVVTASQSGNSTYGAATPVSQTVTVAKAPLTVTVNSFTRGYGVANPTLTGTLNGVVNNDNITVTYATTATITSDPGAYPITATLVDPGGRLVNYNVTNTAGTLTVSIASTSVTFTMSAVQILVGNSVTMTATVTSLNGSPTPQTGTVNFVSGTTVLGSATIASGAGGVTIPNIAVGTYSVMAVFVANTDYATSASATQALSVVDPVTIGLNPSSLSLAAGTGGSSTLTITPAAGFTGSVTLGCTSSQPYITCTITTPESITGTTPVTDTVSVSVAATASLAVPHIGPDRSMTFYAMLLPLGALLMLPLVRRRRAQKLMRLMVLMLLAVGTSVVFTGCGSGSSGGSGSSNLPPAGPQTVTISATAGGTTVTTMLTVNITN